MKRAIYLITGVMASGKSTVAQLLASRLEKGVHLRGDLFRRMIGDVKRLSRSYHRTLPECRGS